MPQKFRKIFKTNKVYAHVRRRSNGLYEIRYQINHTRISVTAKHLDTCKERFIEKLNEIKPVWIELGLQTSNEKSAEYIRRCYKNDVYENAVKELKSKNINVITHIIIGLPNETKEDVLNTVDFSVKCGTDGVKLQLLHILKDTDLFEDYKKGLVKPLSLNEYMDILFECIEGIPKNIVIHRITGDAPKKYLVEPLWSGDKKRVLNTINKEMEKRDIIQGKCSL